MTLPSGSVTLAANFPSSVAEPPPAVAPPPMEPSGAAETGSTLTSVAVGTEGGAGHAEPATSC